MDIKDTDVILKKVMLAREISKTECVNNILDEIKSIILKQISLTPKDDTLQDMFKKFWAEYPCKERKQYALRTFLKNKFNDKSFKNLLRAVHNYKVLLDKTASKTFRRAPMHASTFLNNNEWESYLTLYVNDPNKKDISEEDKYNKGIYDLQNYLYTILEGDSLLKYRTLGARQNDFLKHCYERCNGIDDHKKKYIVNELIKTY